MHGALHVITPAAFIDGSAHRAANRREMNRDMVVFQTVAHFGLRMILAGAVAALFPSVTAIAQVSSEDPLPNPRPRSSLENYSLPPGPDQTLDQNVLQGPVDEETRLARPPVVAPAPARAPAQSDNENSGPADSESSPARTPVRQVPPRPGTTEAVTPMEPQPARAEPEAATAERPSAPDRTITETEANPAPPEALAKPEAPDPPDRANDWLLLLVAALFFAMLSGIYLWRTYRARSRNTKAARIDALKAGPAVPAEIQPAPAPMAPVIAIGFEPRKANANLFNAVVGFELTLSNQGDDALTDIRVDGAMVQAAKNDSGTPLSGDLAPLQAIPSLRAGETETVISELRIPLTSIDPIKFRSQALFVPLVQISIEYTDGAGFEHFQTAAYLVGQEHQPQRPKMAPFRLDLGPRSFAPLGHRRFAEG